MTNLRHLTASAAMRLASVLAVILAPLPLLISNPAPLEDWPSHLARAEIFTSLLRGETFWSPFYHLNTFLLPNIALDGGIAALHLAGVPLALAGQIFLMITYAVFVAAGVWLARVLGESDASKPLLSAMIFYNGALMGGFVNYMIGLGLALCVLAAWIQAEGHPLRRFAVALVGTLCVFFAHLIAAVVLVAAMAAIEFAGLLHSRRFTPGELFSRASPPLALLTIAALLAVSPTSADAPGGRAGQAITYVGAPSAAGIAKGKLTLLFHPLLDGSGVLGATVTVVGVGLFFLLVFTAARPSMFRTGLAATLCLSLLVILSPNGIGEGFGLDYRIVVPAAMVAVAALRLRWRGTRVRWVAFGLLLVTSLARTASFASDMRRDAVTYDQFRAAAAAIPPDSVILTGIGTPRDAIAWGAFWAPPTEYLATLAVSRRIFVPTTFAISSQHPVVLDSRYEPWRPFGLLGSQAELEATKARLRPICDSWRRSGHTGPVLMLVAYPSITSDALVDSAQLRASGQGFRLIAPCG